MENPWLQYNKRRLDGLIYHCEEYRMRGSYGGNLNLEEIIRMFKGMSMEIQKLQREVNLLRSQANKPDFMKE